MPCLHWRSFASDGTDVVQLFRFVAALALVVTISLIGIAMEKDKLSRHRAISLQQYRIEQLLDRRAHLRLQINELTSPVAATQTAAATDTSVR